MKPRKLSDACAAVLFTVLGSAHGGEQATLKGTVERVWEDGFQLNTGERSVEVDSYDIFGDNTPSRLTAGQRVRVSGEMSGGEFDATAVEPLEANR